MPKVTVYNQDGAIVGSQELSDEVFGVKPKDALIHQVVTAMMANKRQVLAHTKGRSEVRGGGKKPWRQKGTGRARHGSIRSPLWVGGGITFGPTKERNFKQKINDKMRRKAILMGLSDRVSDGKMVLLDKIELDEFKTKKIAMIIEKLRQVFYGKEAVDINVNSVNSVNKTDNNKEKIEGEATKEKNKKAKPKKILLLLSKKDEKIQVSCRNIPWLRCHRAQDVNLLDILSNQYILTTVEGVKKIEETFKTSQKSKV